MEEILDTKELLKDKLNKILEEEFKGKRLYSLDNTLPFVYPDNDNPNATFASSLDEAMEYFEKAKDDKYSIYSAYAQHHCDVEEKVKRKIKKSDITIEILWLILLESLTPEPLHLWASFKGKTGNTLFAHLFQPEIQSSVPTRTKIKPLLNFYGYGKDCVVLDREKVEAYIEENPNNDPFYLYPNFMGDHVVGSRYAHDIKFLCSDRYKHRLKDIPVFDADYLVKCFNPEILDSPVFSVISPLPEYCYLLRINMDKFNEFTGINSESTHHIEATPRTVKFLIKLSGLRYGLYPSVKTYNRVQEIS